VYQAFLGGVYAGVGGAVIGLMGINLPGMLLTFGVLPYWAGLRRVPLFKVFITGVTAASIGLLFTACIQLYEAAIGDGADAVVFLFSGTLSAFFHVPVPLSILFGSVLGFIFSPGAASIGQQLYCIAEFKQNNASFVG
jgi:chromate transporter